MYDISAILEFLPCATPASWIEAALRHPEILLIDHANCEKKAAATALNLMFRYIDKPELLNKLSKLAREELRHFEQVLALINKRGVVYTHVEPARYAGGMRRQIRTYEPARLIDTLIVGAFIEARSCERFACLAPFLDVQLQDFYLSLLKSEARHFTDYLSLAERYSDTPLTERIAVFAAQERELIESPDEAFRFHSGPPALAVV